MTANLVLRFDTRSEMIAAARALLMCHPHHFDVRPDDGNALSGLSETAVRCLAEDQRKTKAGDDLMLALRRGGAKVPWLMDDVSVFFVEGRMSDRLAEWVEEALR